MGYLGATLMQVFKRVHAERACHSEMSQWPRWETGVQSSGDIMYRKYAEDLGDFEKLNLQSWELDTGREGSTFGARWGETNLQATGAALDGGCWWKSQNRKNLYLSPYVEETLNSKVMKSFVPELRSRKCFSCFEIPTFYVYMFWTFYVRIT